MTTVEWWFPLEKAILKKPNQLLSKGYWARYNKKVDLDERQRTLMDIKAVLIGLTVAFTLSCLYFGTRNGFYDSDNYHGNGSAH